MGTTPKFKMCLASNVEHCTENVSKIPLFVGRIRFAQFLNISIWQKKVAHLREAPKIFFLLKYEFFPKAPDPPPPPPPPTFGIVEALFSVVLIASL